MALLQTLSFIVLLTALSSAVSIDTSALITSPLACFSNSECPPGRFCNRATEYSRLYNWCLPKLGLGEQCPKYSDACRPGLMCQQPRSGGVPRCMKRISTVGKACQKHDYSNSACSEDERCAPSKMFPKMDVCTIARGRNGDKCYEDDDCDQDGGFYCKGLKVCRPKNKLGTVCASRSNAFCDGFCGPSNDPLRPWRHVCLAQQPIGGRCTEYYHCKQKFYDNHPKGNVICNIDYRDLPTKPGVLGICVRDGDLIKRLGEKCNPKRSLCDVRRMLTCKWNYFKTPIDGKRGRFVCQQTMKSAGSGDYCTPGSKLSICTVNSYGEPTACTIPGPHSFFGLRRFYECVRKKSIVPKGGLCVYFSDAVCTKGTSCQYVPGIDNPICYHRGCYPPLKTCIATRKLGQSCGSKFVDWCGPNGVCINGKCVRRSRTLRMRELDEVCASGLSNYCGSNGVCINGCVSAHRIKYRLLMLDSPRTVPPSHVPQGSPARDSGAQRHAGNQ